MKHNQPDFITPLRNLTVEVGRNATFECFVTGIKKFRVSTHNSSQFLNGKILKSVLCLRKLFTKDRVLAGDRAAG